jgi:hypothetical protein
MKLLCVALVFVGAIGCSSPAPVIGEKQNLSKDITLSDVEGVPIGKTTAKDLRTKFGGPQKVISISTQEEAWFYGKNLPDGFGEQASFVVDKNTGILMTSTWLPAPSNALSRQEVALSHFKNIKFKVTDVGWIAHHEYSPEAHFDDLKSGVSLRINKVSHNVLAISFTRSAPRSLANDK